MRHYCRNPHCRSKLREPVENEHLAFCCKGCFESFYLKRCRVCEKPLREAPRRGQRRLYCRAQKWPERYPSSLENHQRLESADKTAINFGLSGHRPSANCLRNWRWSDPVDGDLSLYDEDGLTIARLVLEDGEHRLRTPRLEERVKYGGLLLKGFAQFLGAVCRSKVERLMTLSTPRRTSGRSRSRSPPGRQRFLPVRSAWY